MIDKDHPADFLAAGWHSGIKPEGLDFGVIHSLHPCDAAAIFTRNNFVGNPVIVGRENAASGKLQTIIVNSGNSNVATGPEGLQLVRQYTEVAAESLGIDPGLILPCSTGVIGRPMPADRMLTACREIPEKLKQSDFLAFAEAIRTTDAYVKMRGIELMSGGYILGIAKGAGMIQPDMATMLSYIITDVSIGSADLGRLIRAVANRSFNRLSVDGDTSTSDTFAILANGAAGVHVRFPEEAARMFAEFAHPITPADAASLPGMNGQSREFVSALMDICLTLTRLIAADGEGASKLIELRVSKAQSREQALKIARSIINSPLIKTAVYGADPNWGRLLMAIGKVFDEPVPIENLKIRFGEHHLNPDETDNLKIISNYLSGSEVEMEIELGLGNASETVWGCDLTEDYVRLNSMYTT
ncbi:MAG: bifunctional ornithine acetyltransferase/N-acetylglutamate synthase [Leptospiraceae bacterium]|nr:bifunctional ornithine acetyltransferase/N-acetylglutamate synthase [Leptospiraceae bacterium]